MKQNIIAIDITTELCSISIFYKKKTFTKYKFSNHENSKYIIKLLSNIIAQNNINLNNINIIAFNNGPGSNTGIRISKCICQILHFKINKIKIFKISSFKIISEQYFSKNKQKKIIIFFYQNKNNIYWNKFINNQQINKNISNVNIFKKKILSIKKKTTLITNNYKTKNIFSPLITKNKYINIKTYYPKSIHIINLIIENNHK